MSPDGLDAGRYSQIAEEQRLAALRRYSILDSDCDPDLDALTRLAARVFDIPTTVIALIDLDRQLFKSRFGTDLKEISRTGSFCDHTMLNEAPLIVTDATKDFTFKNSPYVIGAPHVRFYAGARIVDPDGQVLGSFCIFDTKARDSFSERDQEILRSFADEAAAILTQSTPQTGEHLTTSRSIMKMFKTFVSDLPIAAAMLDRDYKYLAVSHKWYDLFGISDTDIIGRSHLSVFDGLSEERKAFLRAVVTEGRIENDVEMACVKKNGSRLWIRCNTHPWHTESGEIGGAVMYRTDIEAEMTARNEADVSRARHEYLYNHAPTMLYSNTPHGIITQASDFWLNKLGYAREDVIGRNSTQFMTDDSAAYIVGSVRTRIMETGKIVDEPVDFLTKDGDVIHTLLSAVAERDSSGKVISHNSMLFDIGELKRMERKLEEAEANYKEIYNNSPIMLHSIGPGGHIVHVNDFWLNTLGYEAGDVIGKHLQDFMDEESATRSLTVEYPKFLKKGSTDNVPFTLIAKSGKRVYIRLSAVARFDADGNMIHALAALLDETAQHETQAQVNRTKRLFEAFFQSVPAHLYVKSLDGRYLLYNKFFEDAYGVEPGRTSLRASDIINAESAAKIEDYDKRVLDGGCSVFETATVNDNEGRERHLDIRKFPVLDENGEPWLIGGVSLDVTEKHQMETAFRQAQKMEAVGNLTGGIAHDFNNILAIVLGNLQLLQRRITEGSKEAERLDGAIKAAKRGAGLTRQLLAFSRRQELEPTAVDVNATLRDFHKMIARTLSANIAIELALAEDMPPAYIDEGQFQNSILNLAINARDAMPDGGQLYIETQETYVSEKAHAAFDNFLPGRYIAVAITDTGTGMTKDVKERVFEPFFTTKGIGKGTGLGLAMVYGFLKQSGGHVSVYSEVGHGTTIRLYLPIAEDATAASEPITFDMEKNVSGRILIVEDDDGVRSIVQAMLEEIGYDFAEAASGAEALSILETDDRFDLVFSDIIMPGGMTGVDLAKAIAERHPHIPVLLTSGYPREAVKADESIRVLSKPYQQEQLAQELGQAIETHEAKQK